MKLYTLEGYDIDNDVFEVIAKDNSAKRLAEIAKNLSNLDIRRQNGKPINWFQISDEEKALAIFDAKGNILTTPAGMKDYCFLGSLKGNEEIELPIEGGKLLLDINVCNPIPRAGINYLADKSECPIDIVLVEPGRGDENQCEPGGFAVMYYDDLFTEDYTNKICHEPDEIAEALDLEQESEREL